MIVFLLVFSIGYYFVVEKFCIGCRDWDDWRENGKCKIWEEDCFSDKIKYVGNNYKWRPGQP